MHTIQDIPTLEPTWSSILMVILQSSLLFRNEYLSWLLTIHFQEISILCFKSNFERNHSFWFHFNIWSSILHTHKSLLYSNYLLIGLKRAHFFEVWYARHNCKNYRYFLSFFVTWSCGELGLKIVLWTKQIGLQI